MRIWIPRALVLGILAVAAYGFWQGTPQDVVNAEGGPFATVSAMARASGTPVSEGAAREVFATLETTPR